MARRIRAHAWAATALGPVEGWPERLRIIVETVLAMPSPATVLWGPAHVQIYNDAYVAVARDRHPGLLGRPVAEGWPDAYAEVIAPLLAATRAGRTTRLAGHSVTLRGPGGGSEERVFDTDWLPVRDAAGAVAGALQTLTEVTDRHRAEAALRASEARGAFLLRLADAVRALTDPEEVKGVASRLLGEHLGVDRTAYAELTPGGEHLVTPDGYLRPGVASVAGRYRVAEFGAFFRSIEGGATTRMEDAASDPSIPAELYERTWGALGIRAAVAHPVMKRGRFVATLYVHSVPPRRWSDAEVSLVAEVGERTWEAVERARAEAALRESEGRLATVFEALPVGVGVVDREGVLTRQNREMRRFLPTGAIPSRDPSTEERWRAWHEDGTRVAPQDYPGARALRGAGALLSLELLHADDEGEVWTRVAAASLRGEGGEITGAVVVVADIDALKRSGEALRESEERFRAVSGAIEDVFYLTDLDRGALLYLSPAYERIWGRPAAGLMADLAGFADMIHPDDRPALRAGVEAQRRGEPVRIEYRMVRPDGTIRWILDRSFPVEGSAGRRSAGVASDVTARVEAEAALREGEERLRGFGEASSDVLWVRTADTLQWEYLSPAFEAIYGLTREEALSGDNFRSWADLIVEDDRERAVANIRRVGAGERVTFEYRVRRPVDGEVRWLRNTDFPMRDGAGRVTRIGGVGHDVTEMKAIEAAMEAGEERLRVLMEGIPQLVWRSCDEGLWTWSSPQWQDYTGQSQEESRGRGWLAAIHPDDHERTMAAWHDARPHGRLDVEYRVRRAADGAWRWHQTRSLPVRAGPTAEQPEGSILEWLGTTTDIEDLKRLQGQQGILVAELQHRTRNLLSVVRNVARRSIGRSPGLDQYDARLGALGRVQGFLARSGAYTVPLHDLVEAELQAAGDGESDRVIVRGPRVELQGEGSQPVALALHELATNAVKYGAIAQPSGRLSVTWRVEEGENGPRLRIAWRESGVAMPDGPPTRRGYGSELITRALPYQLKAETNLEFTSDGVWCDIALPAGAFSVVEAVT